MIALLMLVLAQDPAADAARRLQDPDIAVREQAQTDLAHMGDAALKVLDRLLDSDDAETARRARGALQLNRRLSRLPAPLAKRRPDLLERPVPLAELLALDLTEEERAFFAVPAARDLSLPPALWLLSVRGRAPAADVARAHRLAPTATLRALALAALQELDAPSAVRLAREAVRSSDPVLRLQACFTLSEVGSREDAAFTAPLVRDTDPLVARAAAVATRRLEPGADVPEAADPGPRLPMLIESARTRSSNDSWHWIEPPQPTRSNP